MKHMLMRSSLFLPGSDEAWVKRSPDMGCDFLGLDVEDGVAPAAKESARQIIKANLKHAGSRGANVFVRLNGWETGMTNHDLESVVWEGLDGVVLPKTEGETQVKRLDWRLGELEAERGLEAGSIKIAMLVETAKGFMEVYDALKASPRNVAAIFGVVDYALDMQIPYDENEGIGIEYARMMLPVACRATGLIAIDQPFMRVGDSYTEKFAASCKKGASMGYQGRMLCDICQVEPSNTIYGPSPADVEWAHKAIKIFEEQGLAKGIGEVFLDGVFYDIPVWRSAKQILKRWDEIQAVCVK
jgi:citrate lyase subunit beta/citryl-CoA lyase